MKVANLWYGIARKIRSLGIIYRTFDNASWGCNLPTATLCQKIKEYFFLISDYYNWLASDQTSDEVEDPKQILHQFITNNKELFETFFLENDRRKETVMNICSMETALFFLLILESEMDEYEGALFREHHKRGCFGKEHSCPE